MSTIFEKIIAREIPAFIIDEDEFHIAFLDVNPLKEGHTLVIPKKPIDYIFDIENGDLSALVIFAKKPFNLCIDNFHHLPLRKIFLHRIYLVFYNKRE
jgi:diadenosine tetraphosphate (Ap4A) HIT family hydrolase